MTILMLERKDSGSCTVEAITGYLSPNKKQVTVHSIGEPTLQRQHLILNHMFLNRDKGNNLNIDCPQNHINEELLKDW